MTTPIKVLFVCMGNICRSPAAEGIFRAKTDAAGISDRIQCDSAGTIGYHSGNRADSRMRAAAIKRGYQLDSISRQVHPKDFEEFDHIIAMDLDNLEGLKSLARDEQEAGRISMMCEYATGFAEREVPDPYYGGDGGFERVLDLLESACTGLLESIDGSKIA